ncbi:Transmembrane protein [Hirschfeldia incana]|nr:Transmembrane protein [Hirschfeldia incana]
MAEEHEKVSSTSALQRPSYSSFSSVKIKPQNPHPGYRLNPGPPYDEQTNGGAAGIYAVPPVNHHQFGGGALPSNYLIPLTYNLPTTRPSNEAESGAENQGQAGQGQGQQQPAHQRQVVVRRFEIAFQLDIFLILKLAAVIFLFNQDGSRQRLAVLVIFATIIYLYQTGALAPFVRWLSQGMHRAAVPPPHRPNRPLARPDDDPPAAAAPLNEAAAPGAEGQENEGDNGRNRGNGNENVDAGQQGNQCWGIVKEIQMIVFGFITSLLPGFHNID